MKINIDRNLCYGTGRCAETLPEVFGQDPRDGLVVLLVDSPQAVDGDDVRFAAQFCPSGCISIENDDQV
ncbi:ferredoxin [Saccharopolyspora sp. ASAGF58]|uniref:ferredoxin n=1 Tax=Saccharopolyspora sp. ASAGF58 TaxID=2719023 RepID=UPI00143FD8B1|nr:ferredoxin [Saccharopolyspora sp. ASAGF58]QIZ38355.1 ferredoxin [Saccharopolyspora sp. ASAGF58]